MNNNKNPNLPANAIRCIDVKVGMMVMLGSYVCRVTEVKWYADRGVIVADGITKRVNAAGTMRLAV